MSNTKYTYAVARIRALETSLLNDAVIGPLPACGTAEQAVQLLIDRGWRAPSAEHAIESDSNCA